MFAATIRGIYPFNPEAIHAKLQNFIDKIEELSQVEKINMCSILSEIAAKHPEVIYFSVVGAFIPIIFVESTMFSLLTTNKFKR